VIHEVDHALRTLIEHEALAGTDVEVAFDAPTKDWAARRTVPTVDVYLYDIREDLRRRERGLLNSYEGPRVITRSLPPRYFKLSYLVTAWTQRPEDEHRLLAALLGCFLRHEAMPAEVLTGPLAELGLPVPVTIALPPPEDRSFADVWSALGGELKPSLDIVVITPTDSGRDFPAAPAITGPMTVHLGGNVGAWPPEESRQGRSPAGLSTFRVGGSGADTADDEGRTAGRGRGSGGRGSGGRGSNGRGAGGRGSDARATGTADQPGPAPTRGLSWQELGAVATEPAPVSAEGAPPRKRSTVSRKDKK
jgi:hypothetical protein